MVKKWYSEIVDKVENPLKTLYNGHEGGVINTKNLVIFKPEVDRSTINDQDIKTLLENFYQRYLASIDCNFAFMSADQQLYIKLWNFCLAELVRYAWLILLPGE